MSLEKVVDGSIVKIAVIMHKANGDFRNCVVECRPPKPHILVVFLGSLTVLGLVAI